MNNRIDHVTEANSPTGPEDELYALRHAVLALVEQQRVANLIAAAKYTGPWDDQLDLLRLEALNTLVRWVPHAPDDVYPEVRSEIAAALGLDTQEDDRD